eukprot:664484-Pelagomonas_calceolata.AAC.2
MYACFLPSHSNAPRTGHSCVRMHVTHTYTGNPPVCCLLPATFHLSVASFSHARPAHPQYQRSLSQSAYWPLMRTYATLVLVPYTDTPCLCSQPPGPYLQATHTSPPLPPNPATSAASQVACFVIQAH